MTLRSGPSTLIPIGVRTPVESMSMRFLIGMVQMFGIPGNRSCSFISSCNSSNVMRSGTKYENSERKGHGQLEYHRFTLRHWLSGLRVTVVSTIENGAG